MAEATPLCIHNLSGECDMMVCAAQHPRLPEAIRDDPDLAIYHPLPCGTCCACVGRCSFNELARAKHDPTKRPAPDPITRPVYRRSDDGYVMPDDEIIAYGSSLPFKDIYGDRG